MLPGSFTAGLEGCPFRGDPDGWGCGIDSGVDALPWSACLGGGSNSIDTGFGMRGFKAGTAFMRSSI